MHTAGSLETNTIKSEKYVPRVSQNKIVHRHAPALQSEPLEYRTHLHSLILYYLF